MALHSEFRHWVAPWVCLCLFAPLSGASQTDSLAPADAQALRTIADLQLNSLGELLDLSWPDTAPCYQVFSSAEPYGGYTELPDPWLYGNEDGRMHMLVQTADSTRFYRVAVNEPPVALVAEAQIDVYINDPVIVSGELCQDPEGLPLRYDWRLNGLPYSSAQDLVLAASPVEQFLEFELTVNDGCQDSAPVTVQVEWHPLPFSNGFCLSPNGNDSNPGTPELPKRNLDAAFTAIQADPQRNIVYMEEGTYSSPANGLISNVILAGGFHDGFDDTDWQSHETIIQDSFQGLHYCGLLGDGVSNVSLNRLTIRAFQPNSGDPRNRIAMILLQSDVDFNHCKIVAPDAGNGSPAGAPGQDGNNGSRGADGQSGCENGFFPPSCDHCPLPEGGNGGGATGGDGGVPGWGPAAGGPGDNGAGGAPGGSGGSPGANGAHGTPGSQGGDGANGTPAGIGLFSASRFGFHPSAGGTGANGTDGRGGGGGGGGGGGSDGCWSYGSGGGGGGGGGQPGTGGLGGKSGGASIALYLVDSTVQIANSTLLAGSGGAPSLGGSGGAGGAGGLPGDGGAWDHGAGQDDAGIGGNGGRGGAGGDGGAGGNGAGGHSICAVSINSTILSDNLTYLFQPPVPGGPGAATGLSRGILIP